MRRPFDPWVIVPVRGEAAGKTRLAPALDRSARMRLNRQLLRRTLEAIARWQGTAGHCIVVSGCERTLRLAQRRGAIAQREPRPQRGLDAAVAHGVERARRGGARRVLVLPADLACVTASSLRRFAQVRGPRAAAIAPDRAGDGTNALLLPARPRFRFAYGSESFVRHRRALIEQGWSVDVCADPHLSFDLDTPHELAAVMRLRREGRRRWPLLQ